MQERVSRGASWLHERNAVTKTLNTELKVQKKKKKKKVCRGEEDQSKPEKKGKKSNIYSIAYLKGRGGIVPRKELFVKGKKKGNQSGERQSYSRSRRGLRKDSVVGERSRDFVMFGKLVGSKKLT